MNNESFAYELAYDRLKIGKRIKGKYKILEYNKNVFKCEANQKRYSIEALYKDKEKEGILSNYTNKISNIRHKNILHIEVLEDDDFFYLIRNDELQANPLAKGLFQKQDGSICFSKLLECYLQICDAISHIHAQNIYHGSITPDNILIETYTYKVFLLEFGNAYYYPLLDSESVYDRNDENSRYISVEQYHKADPHMQEHIEIDTKTDIFSFGLCMLKFITDSYNEEIFKKYKSYQDINQVFEVIYEDDLYDIEKELYLLIKSMLHTIPEDRPNIKEVQEKLRELIELVEEKRNYEINVFDKEVETYCNNKEISTIEFTNHIEERIKNSYAYATFENSEKGDRIKLAFHDIAFYCGMSNDYFKRYLFCFKIDEHPKSIEEITRKGVMIKDDFKITTGRAIGKDDVSELFETIKEQFEEQENAQKRQESNQKVIDSEEKYLNANEQWIEYKKNTKKAKLIEHKRGTKTLCFEITDDFLIKLKDDNENTKEELAQKLFEDDLSDDVSIDPIETFKQLYKKDIYKIKKQELLKKLKNLHRDLSDDKKLDEQLSSKSKKERYRFLFYGLYPAYVLDPKQYKDDNDKKLFKSKYDVCFGLKSNNQDFKGKIKSHKEDIVEIEISNEDNIKDFQKDIYFISYDYQVESIVLGKQQKALHSLKAYHTACPNLLSKINKPQILNDIDLINIETWFDDNLDDNQKLAVQKALSLQEGSEILLIQGPPGTGKTTVITEIIKQYLQYNKHHRILVASQSNQAVDNVLEKICDNVKVTRIGREEPMSEKAKEYTEIRVLDTLLKNNIKSIEESPTDKEELKELQQKFKESLQTLSHKLADTQTQEKTKNQEMEALFLKPIRVIFGTLIGISSWKNFKEVDFDLAIVDEAGRALLSELLVPLIKAKKIILVGDHKQLAPVVDDEMEPFLYKEGITKEEAVESFFGKLYLKMQDNNKESAHHFLNTNYRAHEQICNLYSEAFYEGKLQTPNFLNERKNHQLSLYPANAILLSTSKLKNRFEKEHKGKTGKCNPKHIEIIKTELEKIAQELKRKGLSKTIGIITPYRLQVEELKRNKELKDLIQQMKEQSTKIDIGTVDSFQGSDRDYIIYDSVRSMENKKGRIDFIADEKRLNVSLSRAKELLIVIADAECLYKADTENHNPFKDILEQFYKNKQSVIELKDEK